MKKAIISKMVNKFAILCSSFFALALFIGANSNSSLMMHQTKAPADIKRFSLIR